MPENALIVLTTAPDRHTAERLARHLVAGRFAACVNISAEITSIYRWKNSIETGSEYKLTIKTTRTRYPALQDAICTQHPYELPEIIALPIEAGLPSFLDWIDSCTND